MKLHLRKCAHISPPPTVNVTDNENPARDVNSTLAVPPPDCIPPSKPPDPPAPDQGTADHHEFDFKWGSFDGKSFTKKMNLCYEQIVYWKKNLFLLPKGAAGKQYIREITRLINAFAIETRVDESNHGNASTSPAKT